MAPLRSFIFNILFGLWTAGLILVNVPAIFMDGRVMRRSFRWWGTVSIWLADKIVGAKVEVRGMENMPDGPVIIASKHQSILETQSLFMTFDEPAVVLKIELTMIPFAGPIVRKAGFVILNRSGGRTAVLNMIEQAKERVAQGRKLAIYHEGTRRPVGAPPAYKRGVSILYNALDVPVVPIAINTGLAWPRGSLFGCKPGNAVVEILPPIAPGMEQDKFLKHLEDVVETATNRLVTEGI